jgi:hypothetical protein
MKTEVLQKEINMKNLNRLIICLTAFFAFGLTTISAQSSENRHVRIINRASSPIRYLYASNVDRRSWEEDILGPWVMISTDHYMDVNIDDGSGHCLYDLKAILLDGRTAERGNFNVCTQQSWTVTDGN